MKRKIFLCLICLTFCIGFMLLLASCSESNNPIANDPYILVSLEEIVGMNVVSSNPVHIRSGNDAVFYIEIDPEYKLSLPDGMIFDDSGKLIIKNVLYPETIKIDLVPMESYSVKAEPDHPECGTCTVKSDSGKYIMNDSRVTLSAIPSEDSVFIGYSLGAPLSSGGELISGDETYSFTCTGDVTFIANFAKKDPPEIVDPSKVQRIIYHSNGGKAFGHLDTFYFDYEDDYYYFPNTLPDLGYFKKEGYVLAGYSTSPDGKGEFVGCGWNALTDSNSCAELYAIWLPETSESLFDFEKSDEEDSFIVKSCRSDDEIIVIPESYEGLPVKTIAAGAFDGCVCKTLMITRNITTVEDGAIINCPDLNRIIFSDGILNISDGCINNCPSFSILSMHAVMMPRYCDDREGTYAIKYEHLRASANLPKIMIAAGSNCAYGLDSTILYEALKDDYDIINYGCNAYSPMLFYLEACLPYLNEGDILLMCPEDNDFQFGRGETRPYIWHFFEAAYEAFEFVDQRHFVNTFTSFAEFNKTRMNMRPKTYQDKTRETTNRFGDYCALKVGHLSAFDPFTVPNKARFNPNNVTRYADMLNSALDFYHGKGVKVWMSFSVVNKNYLNTGSLPGGREFEKYESTVNEAIHATVISDMSDYIMDPEYFYNSHQHLNTEGTEIRSRMLLRDIENQLEKEKR